MIIHLSIITITILLMYRRTLKYGYIIDDLEVARPPDQTTKNVFRRVWEHLIGCKYTNNVLAHTITTLLHYANCILIYFAFGRNNVSFLTALLFGLNPVTNASAIWLSGKPYSISTMLLLFGLVFIPVLPFVYGFCVWWAPNSLLFPLIFIMKKPHWYLVLLPIIAIFASGQFRRVYKTRIAGGTNEMVQLHPKKLILVFKTLGYYFRHIIFPIRLGMCHNYLHSFGLSEKETAVWYKIDKYFWIGVALFLAGIYALFHTTNPVAYGFLWFLFLTIQWCNFIMVNHPITERYIYLSSIGLMFVLANLIIGTPIMWMFLTFYAVRLFYFMPAYEDVKAFWKSNTENFPTVAMGYNQYGLGALQHGQVGSAIDIWLRGVSYRLNDFRINYNLANVMMATGNTIQAVQFLRVAESNLDKKNNYDFWMTEIAKIKEELKKRGIDYEHALSTAPAGSQTPSN